MEDQELQEVFDGGAAVNAAGEFEILAITAGVGNGWNFSAAVLKESLSLWQGAQVFVDHSKGARSVRDLAGVLESVAWDEEAQGIRGKLATVGPSGSVLNELGRRFLAAEPGVKPKVGFSADVVFLADGKIIAKIVRVNSLDLVYSPARGGQFVRALNAESDPHPNPLPFRERESELEVFGMEEKGTYTVDAQLSEDLEAARTLLAVQQEKDKLVKEAEAAREIRLQMCGYLLESGLAASKLPAAMQEHLRGQFANKVFEAAELTTALESSRTLVGQLQAALVVQGPGRISGMFNTADQLQGQSLTSSRWRATRAQKR